MAGQCNVARFATNVPTVCLEPLPALKKHPFGGTDSQPVVGQQRINHTVKKKKNEPNIPIILPGVKMTPGRIENYNGLWSCKGCE
jgi:hypothetical protein